MKLFKYIFWLTGAVFVLTSCSKELERINKNPNESEKASPDYLLTNGIKMNVDTYWGTDATMETSLLYVQHWAKIQYTEPDRYIPVTTSIQAVWSNFYAQGIEDFTQLAQLGDSLHNPNYKAVAVIMRSWIFQVLTDFYGDVPYKQAGDIVKYPTPAYDAQRDIYIGLLAELKEASEQITTTGNPIAGDILYSGNMTKWKAFANSLRLRIALRIVDKEYNIAKTVFDEVGTDESQVINSNENSAKLTYLVSPNQNPVSKNRETRNDYRISKTVVDRLRALNDPRLQLYASMPKDTSVKTIVGVTNGLKNDSAVKLGLNKTSDIDSSFFAPGAPAVLFNYAELLFIKAEAAQRGLISGDAATYYTRAVTAALQQYNVESSAIATYLAQPAVQYNAGNYKKSIGDQKWLALFGEGLEAFAEWRRLDYPQLTPAFDGTLEGKIPLRLTYPSSEQALNGASYRAAVANQGADLLTTRLWFDEF